MTDPSRPTGDTEGCPAACPAQRDRDEALARYVLAETEASQLRDRVAELEAASTAGSREIEDPPPFFVAGSGGHLVSTDDLVDRMRDTATGDTADSEVADSEVAVYLANVAPQTRAEIEAAIADGMPEWQALGCARRSCSDQHSRRFGDCALGVEPPPDDRTPIFRKFVADDGLPSMAMVYTHLHWGEGVSTDATRTDREIGIPVCDDDGREIGEMRISYANAGVLGAMLTEASEPTEAVTVESADGRRWTSTGHGWLEHRFDKPVPLTPEHLDPVANLRAVQEWVKGKYLGAERSPHFFTSDNVTIVPDTGPPLPKVWGEEADRLGERLDAQRRVLEIASGRDVPPLPVPALPTGVDDLDSDTYDALRSRYAWLEQRYRDTVGSELAAVNARQAVEIGELRNSIAYKIRAELVCCHHDHGGQCYDGTEQTCHPGCHGAEMAARLAENEVHECGNDTYFDRTVCPEPCGAMHYRCRYCGFVADACPFETSDDTPEQP